MAKPPVLLAALARWTLGALVALGLAWTTAGALASPFGSAGADPLTLTLRFEAAASSGVELTLQP